MVEAKNAQTVANSNGGEFSLQFIIVLASVIVSQKRANGEEFFSNKKAGCSVVKFVWTEETA